MLGVLVGKAISDGLAKPTAIKQIARTSAVADKAYSEQLRRRHTAAPAQVQRSRNPFSREEILNRAGGRSVRRCSTLSNKSAQKEREREDKELRDALENEKWCAIYRYPGVRFAVLLARAKLIQTIASVGYLPYSFYNYSLGTVDATWFWSTASLAIAAPLLLILFSRYLNRLVGVISMNESNTHIRIGYLSFWGGRRNKFLEVDDVLPLTEIGATTRDSMVKLTWFSDSQSYLFLATRNAEIVDEERAQILFGDTTLFTEPKKMD